MKLDSGRPVDSRSGIGNPPIPLPCNGSWSIRAPEQAAGAIRLEAIYRTARYKAQQPSKIKVHPTVEEVTTITIPVTRSRWVRVLASRRTFAPYSSDGKVSAI